MAHRQLSWHRKCFQPASLHFPPCGCPANTASSKKHPDDMESVTQCTRPLDEEMPRSTLNSEYDVRNLPPGNIGHSTVDSLDDVDSPCHMPITLSQALQQHYGPGYDVGGPSRSAAAVRESFLTSSTMTFAYLGGSSVRSSVTSSDYNSLDTNEGRSRLLMDDSKYATPCMTS